MHMKLKISALCALGAVALALIAASSASAADLQYPAACYQGDELKKAAGLGSHMGRQKNHQRQCGRGEGFSAGKLLHTP